MQENLHEQIKNYVCGMFEDWKYECEKIVNEIVPVVFKELDKQFKDTKTVKCRIVE